MHQALQPDNDYTQPQNNGQNEHSGNNNESANPYAPNDDTVSLSEEFHKCSPHCYHNQSVQNLQDTSEATMSFGSASQEYAEMDFKDLDFTETVTPITTSYERSPFETIVQDTTSNDNQSPIDTPFCDGECGSCKKCFTEVAGNMAIDAETDALVARMREEMAAVKGTVNKTAPPKAVKPHQMK